MASAGAFSTNPQFTDPVGDAGANDYDDIIKVWVDNNNTHMMVKVELMGPYNETINFQVIYCVISVNPDTGSDLGWFAGWKADCTFGVSANGSDIKLVFYDAVNGSNSLSDGNQLGYYIQSNDDKTMEIGYPLKQSQGGKGYLDLEMRQNIEIRFYAGGDSDIAPDNGTPAFTYTLKPEQNVALQIVIPLAIAGACAGGALLIAYFVGMRKKKTR